MKRILLILAAGAFSCWLLTGLTMVESNERAVVRRFGRIVNDNLEPGLYVGLPWGIDTVDRVRVDERRSVKIGYLPEMEDGLDEDTPLGQLLTGDHNLINIQAVINFNVRDGELAQFVLQQDRAETFVARTATTVLTEWVAGRKYDSVVELGKRTLPDRNGNPPLSRILVEKTQQRLERYKLGIKVSDARVTFLAPPSEVKPAYDAVTSAETQMRTQKTRAEQERNTKLREAEAQKNRTIQNALAYAQESIKSAEAEATTFENQLEQYLRLRKSNPHYLDSLWLTHMARIITKIRANGHIGLLDDYLTNGGLDITTMTPFPDKK